MVFQAEPAGQMLSQGLHAITLGGVMATGKIVDAETCIISASGRPVWKQVTGS